MRRERQFEAMPGLSPSSSRCTQEGKFSNTVTTDRHGCHSERRTPRRGSHVIKRLTPAGYASRATAPKPAAWKVS